MKVSRRKTKYMCVSETENGGIDKLQGAEVVKVREFRYLGTTLQTSGDCGRETIECRQMEQLEKSIRSNLIEECQPRLKGKVYRTVVRPVMTRDASNRQATRDRAGGDRVRDDKILFSELE